MPIIAGGLRVNKPDIYDILMGGDEGYDPMSLPLFSRLRKGPDTPDTLFQFPADLADEPDDEGSAEGGDFERGAAKVSGKPSLLHGRLHYKKELVGVGEVTEGNSGYARGGVKGAYEYQVRKMLRKLAKHIELITIGAQDSKAGSDTAPYVTRGLENWILPTSLISLQADMQTQVPVEFRPSAGQVKEVVLSGGDYAFTEDDLRNLVAAAYANYKALIKQTMYCTPMFKGKISSLGVLAPVSSNVQAVRKFNQNAESKTIVCTVDKWIGDGGELDFVLHPLLRLKSTQKAEAIGIDERYVQYRTRQAPVHKSLPDNGGGKRGMVSAMLGVQCLPQFLTQVRLAA